MPRNQLNSPSALVSLHRQRSAHAAILGCATSVQHGQPQKRIVGVGRSISSQLVDWKTDEEVFPIVTVVCHSRRRCLRDGSAIFGHISLVFRHTTKARECALVNLAHLDSCLQVVSNSNRFFRLADLFIESLSFVDCA
jgi:hypothetical protein